MSIETETNALGAVLRRNSIELLTEVDRTLAALGPAGPFEPGSTLDLEETRHVMAVSCMQGLRELVVALGDQAPRVEAILSQTLTS